MCTVGSAESVVAVDVRQLPGELFRLKEVWDKQEDLETGNDLIEKGYLSQIH